MDAMIERHFSKMSHYIWGREAKEYDWRLFRSVFQADRTAGLTLLFTSGDDSVVYVNGTLVCRQPKRSFDYEQGFYEVDLECFASPGTNVLVVMGCRMRNYGIRAEVVQGDTVVAATGDSWKTRLHPCYRNGALCCSPPLEPMRHMEEQYDASGEEDWHSAGYDDSDWEGCLVVDGLEGVPSGLRKQADEQLSDDLILPKGVCLSMWSSPEKGHYFRLEGENTVKKRFYIARLMAEAAGEAELCPAGSFLLNGKESGSRLSLCRGENLLVICSSFGELEGKLCASIPVHIAEWNMMEEENQGIPNAWNTPSSEEEGESQIYRALLGISSWEELKGRFEESLRRIEEKEPSAGFCMAHQSYRVADGCFAPIGVADDAVREELPRPLLHPEYMLHQGSQYGVARGLEGKSNTFVLDFEDIYLGYITFSLWAKKGTRLDIAGFESIDEGGVVWMGGNSMRYLCRDGWQEYTAVVPRGFRYLAVSISGSAEPVRINYFGVRHNVCAMGNVGTFRCTEEKWNRIFSISRRTAELCMKDTYVDCPGYEQVYWVGDAMITALVNLTCFGQYRYDQYCIDLTGESLSDRFYERFRREYELCKNGRYLTMCAYSEFARGGIPMWSFLWAVQCKNHYLYGGDREELARNYSYLQKFEENCRRFLNSRNLLEIEGTFNLMDWADNDLPTYGEVTSNSAWYAELCAIAAYFARELGEDDGFYLRQREKVKQAVNEWCWSENIGGYVDTARDGFAYGRYLDYCRGTGQVPVPEARFSNASRVSQQTNTIAYLCGCVPASRERRVKEIIRLALKGSRRVGTPKNVGYERGSEEIVPVGTPFFRFFTLEALFRMGEGKAAAELIEKEWGDMLDKGATTCWETFLKEGPHWTRSVCHAWSASPVVFALRELLGIRPLKAGFREFEVRPKTDMFPEMEGSVATPYGPIFVRCRGERVEVKAPEECHLVTAEGRR